MTDPKDAERLARIRELTEADDGSRNFTAGTMLFVLHHLDATIADLERRLAEAQKCITKYLKAFRRMQRKGGSIVSKEVFDATTAFVELIAPSPPVAEASGEPEQKVAMQAVSGPVRVPILLPEAQPTAGQHHLTVAEQRAMHRALRASTRIIASGDATERARIAAAPFIRPLCPCHADEPVECGYPTCRDGTFCYFWQKADAFAQQLDVALTAAERRPLI